MLLIDRSVVESFHSVASLPALPCPRCFQNLSLTRKGENLSFVLSHSFKVDCDAGGVGPGDGSGRFHAALTCANADCREEVVTIGEFKERLVDDQEQPADDPGATGPPGYEGLTPIKELRFHSFLPALPVFRIPEKAPPDVNRAIKQAFRHSFADPSAAGNALRRSIERLLDHFKVRKTAMNGDGKRKLKLQRRLR
jgi:hypothetical protein